MTAREDSSSGRPSDAEPGPDAAGGRPAGAPCRSGRVFIEVEDLHKKIGRQKILRGVTTAVHEGDTLVIIGRSGEGKSVFLKHLLGLMKPDRGRILVEGRDLCPLRERELGPIRRKIGILFQNGALFDSMTVAENVAFPLIEGGVRDRAEIRRRVHEALDVVRLAEHKHKMPINLSGGMRKRVALARAIVSRPKGILYDEPTSGLDPVVADSIDRLIMRLQRDLCVTSVVVTHDMQSARKIADQIVYLREGRVYFEGTPAELDASEDPVLRAFVEGRSDEDS